MDSCMLAAVHLDKDGDQSQRVLRNMDVDQIQKMYSTTLNQVQHGLQERELSGFYGQLEWTDSQLDVLCFAARQHLQTIARKGVRLRGFCSVPWRQMSAPPNIEEHVGARANFAFRRVSRVSRTLRHRKRVGRVRVEDFPRTHFDTTAPRGRDNDERRAQNSSRKNSRTASSSHRCTTTQDGRRKTTETPATSNFITCIGKCTIIPQRRLVFFRPQRRRKVVRDPLQHTKMMRSPSFPCLKSFAQRNTASKDGGKVSVHYNAEPQTSELLLRTIVAANQHSI